MRDPKPNFSKTASWNVLALSMALLAAPAHAAIDCVGTVERVLLYNDGTVNVLGSWRGDYTYVCSTTGSWGSIPSEVCLAWYGTLVKALKDRTKMTVYYEVGGACNNLPTYSSSPVPLYMGATTLP